MSNCAIILAGGEGKRMKSDKPKTLSPVLGKPMLLWVISALKNAGIDDICVVKGFKKECVEEFLGTLDEEKRAVFIRRYCFYETAAQIAGNFGIGESKVRVMLFRTRKKLKKFIEGKGVKL